jgi:hypothetical protein
LISNGVSATGLVFVWGGRADLGGHGVADRVGKIAIYRGRVESVRSIGRCELSGAVFRDDGQCRI